MDVTLPDGTVIKDVPDGTSKADLTAKLKANGYDTSKLEAPSAKTPDINDLPSGLTLGLASPNQAVSALAAAGKGFGQVALGAQDLVGGLQKVTGRGLSAVGVPDEMNVAAKAGNWLQNDAATGRKNIEAELAPYKARDPFAAGAGELTGQVVGTLPVGGAIAAPVKLAARAAPFLAPVLGPIASAIESAGFTTGRAAAPAAAPVLTKIGSAVANQGTRAAGGAITGGASTALVEPENVGIGTAIGAALPGTLSAVGKVGRFAGDKLGDLFSKGTKSAQDLATALGLDPNALGDIVARLRGAPTLVPNAAPTVAQALQTPEAGIVQRVVHDVPGGMPLRQRLAQQAEARTAALEGVAPTQATGPAMARENLGQSVARAVIPARAAEKARVSALYDAVDPAGEVKLQLPIDDLTAARDKFLGPGTFGQGSGAENALRAANEVGTEQTPAVVSTMRPAGVDERTLGQEVRRLGIHPDELKNATGYAGEVRHLRESSFGRGMVNKNGRSLEDMAARMHEDGYLDQPDVGELVNKLTEEASGSPIFSRYGNPERMARDTGMPEKRVTSGTSTPVPVDWRTLQNFRSSLGDAAAAAEAKGATQDAAALHAMHARLGDRIDQAGAAGFLKDGESFPLEAYARWTDANSAHAALKAQYDTGPLAGIFRKGPNGESALQGGEIASRAWGARPGQADDVKAFRRLIADRPDLMNQFRIMITTEGAGTADAANNLTTKFSRWVDQTLPGLHEAFKPEDVQALQRIAQDIDRNASATAAGKTLGGSDTFQKANNALSLGLLDSPALTRAASMVPGVRYAAAPALEGARSLMRNRKAAGLAELLSDSGTAATALEELQRRAAALSGPRRTIDPALQSLFYRSGPIAGAESR